MQSLTATLPLRAPTARPLAARRPLLVCQPALVPARKVLARATYNITFRFPDGNEATVPCEEDQYILDAAEDAGVELPYACHGGTCSSCCCKVVSGQLDQSEQSYLDEGEMAKGFALICSSYPLSDMVLETHQEAKLQDEALEEMKPAH